MSSPSDPIFDYHKPIAPRSEARVVFRVLAGGMAMGAAAIAVQLVREFLRGIWPPVGAIAAVVVGGLMFGGVAVTGRTDWWDIAWQRSLWLLARVGAWIAERFCGPERRGPLGVRLMRARVGIGSMLGVPISVHWSWIVFIWLWVQFGPAMYSSRWWLAGELGALFAIVLLHELGHAVAARWVGLRAREIVLWPLGGVAVLEWPKRWSAEFVVAVAGPVVNALLAPVLYWVWYRFGYFRGGDVSQWLWSVGSSNLGLLMFNLLPVWPLDGGRILTALTQRWIGFTRSTVLSGVLGLCFASAAMAWFVHAGYLIPVGILTVLMIGCAGSLHWGLLLLHQEKRCGLLVSAACPQCGSHPLDATTGQCEFCGQYCNLFCNEGRCWSCGNAEGRVRCRICGAEAAPCAWMGWNGGDCGVKPPG